MCLTPQYAQSAVLFKTLNLLLPAVLLICLIPLGSAGCPPGQFLHFNPETNVGVCCITRPLPIGHRFISCTVNGTLDRIEKCPEGYHQPDNTTTESEATCFKFECSQEDNVKVEKCDASGQNCVNDCVCNYEGGYCGEHFYDCTKFPKDCPSELVQRDCSCRRDPPPVSSLPENASNEPGQMIITTSSTKSSDGGFKPTQENDATNGDGAFDNANGTTNYNGTESVPDQTQSTALNIGLITIGIILCVGVVAVVILAYIFRRCLKKWLSKYKNFCCWNRTTNPDQGSELILDSVVCEQGKSSKHSKEEAEPFLSGDESEDCNGAPNKSAGGENDDGSIHAGGENDDGSIHAGGENDDGSIHAGGENDDGSIQAGGAHMQSLVKDTAGSRDCIGDQKNPADDQGEDDSIQADGSCLQSLVVDHAGSKGCIGDQKNPAGDQDEGDSIQAGVSSIQSLVVDHDKMVRQGIETAGPFCSCCDRHWKRCKKLVMEQSLAMVKPQQGVNGIRQTSQFLEILGNVESDRYSSFSSSILHDPESHDSTNTADEETFLKPVSGQETTSNDDQISSIGQYINEVEGTRFEKSQQAELDNEDCMTTSMSTEDPYRTDSHSVVMNYEEEEETVENDEDAEEVSNTEAA